MDKKKTYNVKDCIFSKSISSLKLSFRANYFIRNNITRRLIIFGINKIDAGYCLFMWYFGFNFIGINSVPKWLLESKAKILDNKQ